MSKDPSVADAKVELRPTPALIRSELERLLKSDCFKNSKRCKTLLSYTVEEALAGRGDHLKERLLGVNVFGRSPEYDTAEDPVVRNAAIEVRKRLAQCYLESGNDAAVRIELHSGTYVPEFHASPQNLELPSSFSSGGPTETRNEDSGSAAEQEPAPTRKLFHRVVLGVGLAVLLGAGVAYFRAARSDFDRFWSPVFASHEPVQIVVGQPSGSYHFIGPRYSELRTLFRQQNGNSTSASTALIRADDILWDNDRYLYMGDAFAMTKLSTLVQGKGSTFSLRPDTATNYSELRGSPVIAIGAFNNTWAQRLGEGTRFRLSKRVVDGVEYTCVADLNEPNAKKWMIADTWMIPHSPPPAEDYAIVTRVVDPSTERTVVLVAGIYDAGTRAASEFVTEPAYMNVALRSAPRGWERRNIQLVLHTKIIAGTPGPAKVVAMHFW